MTKPVIVTRAGKGSALTWTEGDSNLTNLQNATITVTDGTSSTAIDLNGTITFTAGSGISVDETSGTITIANTQSAGATDLDGLSDVQITTPSNGQILSYSSSSSKWENVGTTFITALSDDANPQLGANLKVAGYSIVSESNGNITIAPNGTGKTKINAINYNEGAIYDLGTTGGTVAPDVANGNVQKITLNSALTLNAFTNPVAGQSLTLIIYGGTAYTSITSTMLFAGGVKTLTGTASCVDIVSIYYDGTNYFASLGKGFA